MVIDEREAQADSKKQLYLKRVNAVFADIKKWMKYEPLFVEQSTTARKRK